MRSAVHSETEHFLVCVKLKARQVALDVKKWRAAIVQSVYTFFEFVCVAVDEIQLRKGIGIAYITEMPGCLGAQSCPEFPKVEESLSVFEELEHVNNDSAARSFFAAAAAVE